MLTVTCLGCTRAFVNKLRAQPLRRMWPVEHADRRVTQARRLPLHDWPLDLSAVSASTKIIENDVDSGSGGSRPEQWLARAFDAIQQSPRED